MEDELQPWQKDILEMEIDGLQQSGYDWGVNSLFEKEENRLYLTKSQIDMLKKALDYFWVSDSKERGIVEAVVELGFYFERDKELLNKVRKKFLKRK